MTQERLAEFIGCSIALVSMIERGERGYDQAFLEAAAEGLGTSPDRLLRINPLAPASEETLCDAMRRVPEGDIARVQAIIEAFIPKQREDDPIKTSTTRTGKATGKHKAG